MATSSILTVTIPLISAPTAVGGAHDKPNDGDAAAPRTPKQW